MAQAPADFIQAGVHLGRAPAEIQTNLHLQQITQQLTQIGQTLQRLDRSINDVKVQMKNYNTNSIRQRQKSYATHPDDPLRPLLNPTTGIVIPNLPNSSTEISRMTGPQLRAILEQLEDVVPNHQPGGVVELRRQLRSHMGLRAEQQQGA